MADDAPVTSDSKHQPGGGVLWLIPVLVIVYALSPGPVFKVLGRTPAGRRPALMLIYAPLIFLDKKVPAVHSFYDWYGKLWGL
jgi:hypothetical protein